jgi:shikimate dehydrogenase
METSPKKAAVLGHPIAQSLSPRLHDYWLKQHGIEGNYTAIETTPNQLKSTLIKVQEEGYSGVNLTLPLKESALPLLDEIDPQAKRIGAVNTIVFCKGKTVGYNTDSYGFWENICRPHPPIRNKAVILGAGGAARAVVAALQEAGFKEIILCNRSEERAKELMESLTTHHSPLTTSPWQNRHLILEETNLLVNTTSLGMTGQPPLEIDLEKLLSTALVTDIVYKPLTTALLHRAIARGNPTVDGLGMLLYQGQKAFELFFGILPEVTTDLREAMQC